MPSSSAMIIWVNDRAIISGVASKPTNTAPCPIALPKALFCHNGLWGYDKFYFQDILMMKHP